MTIQRIPIENRDQWLKLRGQDVTASIAGCLLGVHPYITMLGAYLLKSGLVTEDPEDTPQFRRGRLLEPVAIQMLREDYPQWIDTASPNAYYRDPDALLGATPDVITFDGKRGVGVVQIKSVTPWIFKRDWKDEDGAVTPPLWIVVQALIEAHLTGAEWAAVAAVVVGFGIDLHVVDIPLHVGIIERIKTEVAAFWDRVARGDPPAADFGRDGALIARLYPEANGSVIDLSNDNMLPVIAAEDRQLMDDIKGKEDRRAEIKSIFRAKLGAASIATFQGGRVTGNTINRKAYSVAAKSYRDIRVRLEAP